MRARRFLALAAALALVAGPAASAAPSDGRADFACDTPMAACRLEASLPRAAATLRAGGPLRIVALGSSSTAGAGASSASASYPARLAVELGRLRPRARVEVLNRGVNGEDVAEQLARLDVDVIGHAPDLVVWQIGTNAVLRSPVELDAYEAMVRRGIARIRAVGADVVLMDLQYAPRVLAAPAHGAMVARLAAIARSEGVPLFRRFEMMRLWSDALRADYRAMLDADGLHLNDASYGCLAFQLAHAIAGAAGEAHAGR